MGHLPKALRAGIAGELALALLDRSIEYGHARLAVVRLSIAVHARADITEQHWAYCTTAATLSRDTQLQGILLAARIRSTASNHRPQTMLHR